MQTTLSKQELLLNKPRRLLHKTHHQSSPSRVSPLGLHQRRRHPNPARRKNRLWPETGPSIAAASAPTPPYAHRRAPSTTTCASAAPRPRLFPPASALDGLPSSPAPPEIRAHTIQCRVPGDLADPVPVRATPARPGAHASAPRQPRATPERAQPSSMPRHLAAHLPPAARGPDAPATRGSGPRSALEGPPPSPARQESVST